MLYTGKEAEKICKEALASLNEDGRYPCHYGGAGYFQNPDGIWSAFDNATGDCFCEDFNTEQEAKDWCEGKFEV